MKILITVQDYVEEEIYELAKVIAGQYLYSIKEVKVIPDSDIKEEEEGK